ncbi:MAG: hypothetical protein HC817_02955 [Saprospiraceae bacterium]|nr:hypothetical protein [Saprospiraceae bacterium]
MSILQPYKFKQLDNKYSFITDNSIVYSVDFTDGSIYFYNLPPNIPVFELNIKVRNAVESNGQPYDKRMEVTIAAILSTFFKDNMNSLIYVCDNLDNRQKGRFRKFESWFKRSDNTQLEKYDVNFTTQDMQILASLIIHIENPHKDLLVNLFFDLYK